MKSSRTLSFNLNQVQSLNASGARFGRLICIIICVQHVC